VQPYDLQGTTQKRFFQSKLVSDKVVGLLCNIDGVKPIGVIMQSESDIDPERVTKLVLDHFRILQACVDWPFT